MNDRQDNTLSVDEFIKIVDWVRSWQHGDLSGREEREVKAALDDLNKTLDTPAGKENK